MPAEVSVEQIELAAAERGGLPACSKCAIFASAGWESFPATASEKLLALIGHVARSEDAPATLEEFHPAGTTLWSPDAPIALRFHPCNIASLWQCCQCGKPYLRYTEYGGYYEERRIRELRPERISLARPAES